MEDVVKIFLSYARQDRGRADAVKTLLELGGAQVFMDWRSIRPGVAWESALAHSLADCDVLCVFWSAATPRSSWVRDEYTTFTRRFPDRPCIPLCADETPLPAHLARRQAPPEFLALANELVALRRELAARGVSRRETRRILQDRISRLGLQLDNAQRRKLFGLFASGMSLGLVMASVSKPLKVGVWLAAMAAAASLTWRSCSTERAPTAQPHHAVAASDREPTHVHGQAALRARGAPALQDSVSPATPSREGAPGSSAPRVPVASDDPAVHGTHTRSIKLGERSQTDNAREDDAMCSAAMTVAAMREGYRLINSDSGRLEEGDVMNYDVTFSRGNHYLILACGDSNAIDLDIYLYDEDDNLIDRDQQTDNRPIVTVTPRWTGPFRIRVKNYEARGAAGYTIAILVKK